jgi:hypothetical protein
VGFAPCFAARIRLLCREMWWSFVRALSPLFGGLVKAFVGNRPQVGSTRGVCVCVCLGFREPVTISNR